LEMKTEKLPKNLKPATSCNKLLNYSEKD